MCTIDSGDMTELQEQTWNGPRKSVFSSKCLWVKRESNTHTHIQYKVYELSLSSAKFEFHSNSVEGLGPGLTAIIELPESNKQKDNKVVTFLSFMKIQIRTSKQIIYSTTNHKQESCKSAPVWQQWSGHIFTKAFTETSFVCSMKNYSR